MNKVLGGVCLGFVLVAGTICVAEEQGTTGGLLIGYPDTVWSEEALSEKFRRSREYEAFEVLPLAVAKRQGLFAKHGVAVQFKAVPVTARAPLLEHDVLFGYPFRDFVDPKASPDQIRFMFPFAMTKDGDTIKALVVKKQAGIKDWVDFTGKGIAVSSPLEVTFFLDYIAPKVGLCSKDIKWDVLMGPRRVEDFPTNEELQAFYCDKATMRELLRHSPDELAVFASNLGSTPALSHGDSPV